MSELRETITFSEAQPPLFVGIDVGGTNIKIGLVDDHGRTLGYKSIPTTAETGATSTEAPRLTRKKSA